MATPDTIDAALWIRTVRARERTGLSQTNLVTFALAGRIRTLAMPGVPIRSHAGDCDSVRAELAASVQTGPVA